MDVNKVSFNYISQLVDSVKVKIYSGRDYPKFNESLWKGLNDVTRLYPYL